MKTLSAGLLCLSLSLISFGQTFHLKGTFSFKGTSEAPNSRIIAHRVLDGGKRLLLIGPTSTAVWDIETDKVISSSRFETDKYFDIKAGAISPDGSRIIDLSRPIGAETGWKRRAVWGRRIAEFSDASVLDTQTGKRITVLDRPVLDSKWSKNGKILLTTHVPTLKSTIHPLAYNPNKEFSFWDGKTLKYKYTIKIDNLLSSYLSEDGSKFFTMARGENKKAVNQISVWDVATGKLEKTLSPGNSDYFFPDGFDISEHDKYLGIVARNVRDSKDTAIYIWEINSPDMPVHVIKPDRKISGSFNFSRDEQLLAVDTEDVLKIFQIETGKQTSEVALTELPAFWLAGNKIFLYDKIRNVTAFSVPERQEMYKQKLRSSSHKNSGWTEALDTEVTDDQTFIDPHPDGDKFITHSNDEAAIRDARTGAELQPIPNVLIKKGSSLDANRAGWVNNGEMLYVLEGEKEAISIWGIK